MGKIKHFLYALLPAAASVSILTGCSISETNRQTVTVQSVASLAGLTDVIQQQHFIGVVNPGKEESINRDSNRKIAKVNVKEGDIVNAGDVLFVYDEQDMQDKLETEKLQLEIDRANLASEKKTLENLEKSQSKASADKQLEYALTIREQELSIQEKEYNIGKKEKEIQSMEDNIGDTDVTAPFAGRITKAGKADTLSSNDDEQLAANSPDDADSSFIKLVEIDNYRIKGTINEQNRGDIQEGDSMKIYPRTNEDRIWYGEVTEINYKEAQKSNDMYGASDENASSKYSFYVSIDDLDGLIIGQHVYMRVDDGTPEADDKIRLSTAFLNDMDASPWIWAEDGNGRLEKRTVTLGERNEETDTVVIETGLSDTDFIAAPGEYEEGMPCAENTKEVSSEAEMMPEDELGDLGDFAAEDEIGGDNLGDEFFADDMEDDFGEFEDDFTEYEVEEEFTTDAG